MTIDSLKRMERIVNKSENLQWDGWDVLWYIPYPAGFLKTDGAIKDGKWYRVKRFTPSRDGWHIPRKLVGS